MESFSLYTVAYDPFIRNDPTSKQNGGESRCPQKGKRRPIKQCVTSDQLAPSKQLLHWGLCNLWPVKLDRVGGRWSVGRTRRNRQPRAAVEAAERVGDRAEASPRRVHRLTSTTWSPVPLQLHRPRCRPNRGASASFGATTTSDQGDTLWPMFGEYLVSFRSNLWVCSLSLEPSEFYETNLKF